MTVPQTRDAIVPWPLKLGVDVDPRCRVATTTVARNGVGMVFTGRRPCLQRIDVWGRGGVATGTGIVVGSTMDSVKKAYPMAIEAPHRAQRPRLRLRNRRHAGHPHPGRAAAGGRRGGDV